MGFSRWNDERADDVRLAQLKEHQQEPGGQSVELNNGCFDLVICHESNQKVYAIIVISVLTRKFKYLNNKIDLVDFQEDEEGELKSENIWKKTVLC